MLHCCHGQGTYAHRRSYPIVSAVVSHCTIPSDLPGTRRLLCAHNDRSRSQSQEQARQEGGGKHANDKRLSVTQEEVKEYTRKKLIPSARVGRGDDVESQSTRLPLIQTPFFSLYFLLRVAKRNRDSISSIFKVREGAEVESRPRWRATVPLSDRKVLNGADFGASNPFKVFLSDAPPVHQRSKTAVDGAQKR